MSPAVTALEQVGHLASAKPVDELLDVRLITAPFPLTQISKERLQGTLIGAEFVAARLPEIDNDIVAMRRPVPVLPRHESRGSVFDFVLWLQRSSEGAIEASVTGSG
jgi:hypothetical protein